jgi:hypothetical protein
MLRLLRKLIGVSLMISGFFTMIGLSIYLLVTGVVHLIKNGATMSVGEISWEVISILFRDVVAFVCGFLLMLIGLVLIGKKRKIPFSKLRIDKEK